MQKINGTINGIINGHWWKLMFKKKREAEITFAATLLFKGTLITIMPINYFINYSINCFINIRLAGIFYV